MPDITSDDLVNAHRDVIDLGSIVNGAPTDPDVVTRLGQTVKPVAKVMAGLEAVEETASAARDGAVAAAAEAEAAAAEAVGVGIDPKTPRGRGFSVVDVDGLQALGVRDDRTTEVIALEINGAPIDPDATLKNAPTVKPNLGNPLNFIPLTGESTSMGRNATPALSTVQHYDSLMFVGGARPLDSMSAPAAYASLVPLVESNSPDGTAGETPASGYADSVKAGILASYGLKYSDWQYQLLFADAGTSGSTIAGLISQLPTIPEPMITNAKTRADALGLPIICPAIGFSQMLNDYTINTTGPAWQASVVSYINSLKSQIRTSFGQTFDPIVIMTQECSHGTSPFNHPNDPYLALQLRNMCRFIPGYYLAFPNYILTEGDNTHPNNVGQRIQGAYWGRVHQRVVIEGRQWQHLDVQAVSVVGNVTTLTFNNKTPLVIDTTLVAPVANYGFSMTDSGGTAIAISDVSLVGANEVQITSASAPSAIYYARGRAGNLRDSAGDSDILDPGGINWPMHNWFVIALIRLP